jgi:chemotaxis protein CheC
MFRLAELEHDALLEIFNMGVGRAAAAMGQIVNEEVTMSFPAITFQTCAEATAQLGGGPARRLCAIIQQYQGVFNAQAILMFAEQKSMEIVALMLGRAALPLVELSEMEQEALSEVGNIVLNCCMSTLADMTGQELHGSLPEYRLGNCDAIFNLSGDKWNGLVLTLKIDFNIETHQIDGYLALLLDLPALSDLQAYLHQYLARLEQ